VTEYRVQLDVYNGPMDLLLYLIRKEEVDIYDIPIARVTRQYVEYLELLEALDVNLAGEFLVMAATLMELKSRMLLPHPPPVQEGEEEDPRAELVRELLEYQKFRDAAEQLKERADQQKLRYPRLARPELADDREPTTPLEQVEIWDIFSAFQKLMKDTMGRLPRTIIYDDVPVREFMDRLVERLRLSPGLSFWEVFEDRRDRMYVVGQFLALLELIRRRIVWAVQQEPFGDIFIQLRAGSETGQAGVTGSASDGRHATGTMPADGTQEPPPDGEAEPGPAPRPPGPDSNSSAAS